MKICWWQRKTKCVMHARNGCRHWQRINVLCNWTLTHMINETPHTMILGYYLTSKYNTTHTVLRMHTLQRGSGNLTWCVWRMLIVWIYVYCKIWGWCCMIFWKGNFERRIVVYALEINKCDREWNNDTTIKNMDLNCWGASICALTEERFRNSGYNDGP